MKRFATIAFLAAFLVPASAQANVTASISAPQQQAFAAGLALADMANPQTVGPTYLYGTTCKKVKRNRWRCPRTFAGTLPDSTPINCAVTVLVSRQWWRFPPESFGCPAQWLPH